MPVIFVLAEGAWCLGCLPTVTENIRRTGNPAGVTKPVIRRYIEDDG